MIIGLVAFLNPSARTAGQGRAVNLGTIGGASISEEDFAQAYREAELRFFMAYGRWPDAEMKQMGFDANREAYQRVFFVRKLKEYNIQVDPAAVAKAANSILTSLGRGNRVPLEAFVKEVLAPRHMDANDFERYLRHQLGIEQLISIAGLSGKLVTPAEAQSSYVREQQEVSVEPVFFNASNYLASVAAPTPDTLAQFYTNHMVQYRIPDRLQVSYVKFDATNFFNEADQEIAKMTNFNAIVDQVFLQRGTNYYKESLTPEQTKTRIREDIRKEFALSAAHKKANQFATELDDINPKRPVNLAMLAQTNGLKAKVSSPFSDYPPEEIGTVKDFVRVAESLSDETPFAGPIVGSDAVFVIALDKKLPGEVPALDKIHAQVESDFKLNQATMLARRTGFEFAQTLTNGLAQGKTFAGICTEAKVKPTSIPPFALGTRELPQIENEISLNQLKQIVFDTPVGKSSGFVPTVQGGVVVYVRERLPIDQAKMRAEMPAYVENLRRARENEAINFWFRREAERDAGFREIMDQLMKNQQRGARS